MKSRLLNSFDFRFPKASLLKPSVVALLAANLYPLFGVLFLGWDSFSLLVLFWIENLVVGFYTVMKMLQASRANASRGARVSSVLFFCVHYGMFAVAHGVFIVAVFGWGLDDTSQDFGVIWQKVTDYQLLWGVLALFVSHGVSFFQNYVRAGEYRQAKLGDLMMQPYGRVVVLHLTIIFGAILVTIFSTPIAGLVLLVVLKTAMDMRAHLREHGKYSTGDAPEPHPA